MEMKRERNSDTPMYREDNGGIKELVTVTLDPFLEDFD
jgi:hypothetical protein